MVISGGIGHKTNNKFTYRTSTFLRETTDHYIIYRLKYNCLVYDVNSFFRLVCSKTLSKELEVYMVWFYLIKSIERDKLIRNLS